MISTIIPSKSKVISKINLVDDETGSEIKEEESADHINTFFSTIGSKLAGRMQEPWESFGMAVEEECPDLSTDFKEVLDLCKNINTSKSSGIEDIASKNQKHAFLVLIPQLVYLFNLSFETKIFPGKWKKATVIPLYKGGDRAKVENYRPISVLPLPGKLIEKVAHSRMSLFLESNKLLTDKQNGFHKGFSTTSAVADLTDDLFTAINDNEISIAVFVDLRKAFDTVNHKILVKKLERSGIQNNVLNWCTNYLLECSQTALANNVRSTSRDIVCGVLQGSVLGPLFFIMYVNDLQQALVDENVSVQLYADDTVLYASGSNIAEVSKSMQAGLNNLYSWCLVNKLTLNPAKTRMVTFGTRQKVKKSKLQEMFIGGKKIKNVSTYKYLGFTLDSALTHQAHITDVLCKVMHKKVLLTRIMPFINKSVALLIYKTMILPYVDYCDIIYHSACSNSLDNIQRLQNKCLKTCLSMHKLCSTEEVHSAAKCSLLELRRETHMLNFMFIRQKREKLMDTRNIRTRLHDAPVFKTDFPHKETYKRAVKYTGSLLWNELPVSTRQIDNLAVLKYYQKKRLTKK